jgi:hypothetical protein
MDVGLGFYDWLALVSNGLIAISYTMRDIKWLRVITVVACIVDLVVFYFVRPRQPMWVQFGMTVLFIAINLYQLYVLWREKQATIFEGEQAWLYQHVFHLLSPGEYKRLLKLGGWRTVAPLQNFMRKGEPVDQLGFVVDGRLDALWGATVLNSVPPGGVVGEISYLTGKTASAEVVAGIETRLFCLSHSVLNKLKIERPELHNKIVYVLSREVVDKLAKSNQQVVEWASPQFSG